MSFVIRAATILTPNFYIVDIYQCCRSHPRTPFRPTAARYSYLLHLTQSPSIDSPGFQSLTSAQLCFQAQHCSATAVSNVEFKPAASSSVFKS